MQPAAGTGNPQTRCQRCPVRAAFTCISTAAIASCIYLMPREGWRMASSSHSVLEVVQQLETHADAYSEAGSSGEGTAHPDPPDAATHHQHDESEHVAASSSSSSLRSSRSSSSQRTHHQHDQSQHVAASSSSLRSIGSSSSQRRKPFRPSKKAPHGPLNRPATQSHNGSAARPPRQVPSRALEKPPDAFNISLTRKEIMCYLNEKLGSAFRNESRKPNVMKKHNASCAVVSSSGALLHHNFASEINRHDVVMRFNSGPTVGYERHVGNWTNLRVGWRFTGFENDTSIYRVRVPNIKNMSMDVLRYLYPGGRQRGAKTSWPTMGFYGMLLALFNCGTVDSYEMAPSRYARISRYCYYRNTEHGMKANQNHWHGFFSAEHDLWIRLSVSSKEQIFNEGKAHYEGISQADCLDVPRL